MTSTQILISRRALVAASLAFPLAARASENSLASLESKSGGRLGVMIVDTASGRMLSHRALERFAMCSTFKLLAAAALLRRVDEGRERLDRQIAIDRTKLVTYSPATDKHAGGVMSLAELCEAAVTLSDNTAANLILEAIGGPGAVTALARSLGDDVTRLDRNEPTLNDVPPGELRDTTTPAAMAHSVRALVLGDALSASSRQQLTEWLVANKTGDRRLRAGLPTNWRIGDKTGSGLRGEANDVTVIWPAGRAAVLVTAYYKNEKATVELRDNVLAEVGRIAAPF